MENKSHVPNHQPASTATLGVGILHLAIVQVRAGPVGGSRWSVQKRSTFLVVEIGSVNMSFKPYFFK